MTADETWFSPTLDASSTLLGGRYAMLGVLGAGGMGSVFKVRDQELDEVIALKMLRGDFANPAVLARFRAEVKLARRVTHRNVARTFDIGEHGDARFLTMELVEGESLATRLARVGPHEATSALELAKQLAAGLAAAHAAGVVHRDLKGANVVVEAGGRAVITDFGIAHAEGSEAVSGAFVGTPATMAPEQVRGVPDIDARADVYALGAVLFELLTGTPVWSGTTPFEIAFARLSSPPPDPRTRVASIPAALVDLVLRFLATDREARPRDGAAALAALAALEPAAWTPALTLPRDPRARALDVAPLPVARLTVAVPPMRVAAGDAELGEELTQDLVDRLTRAGGLRVRAVSTQRLAALASAADDPQELGRALDVNVVVESSLRRRDGQVRLAARALDVGEGFQIWAEREEGPEGALFAMNDRLACALGEALSTTMRSEGRRAVANPRALEHYVAARHALRLAWAGTLPLAPVVAQFDEALALAPDDPLILAGAAMARARARNFEIDAADAGPHAAQALARRAQALAPDAAEPRLALATIAFADCAWPEAVGELRAALQRAPALAQAHFMLGVIQSEIGAAEDALARLGTAFTLDGSLLQARAESTRLHALLGRWSLVEAAFELPIVDAADATNRAATAARLNLWRGARVLPVQREGLAGPLATIVEAFERGLAGEPLPLDPLLAAIQRARRGSRFRHALLQLGIELALASGARAWAEEALLDAGRDRLFDLLWLDRCPALAPLRESAAFAEARGLVEARAAEVRAALTRPLD